MTISFEQPRKIPVDGGAVNKGVWISPLSVTGAACILSTFAGPRPAARPAERDYRASPDRLDRLAGRRGQRNLAPYSFFNCFNYRPPIIGFASSGWKDSVRNIVETKSLSGTWPRARWPKR
jgi:hypothetical protein